MRRLSVISQIKEKMIRNKSLIKKHIKSYVDESDGRKTKGIISKIDELKAENKEYEHYLNKLEKIKGNDNLPFKNKLTFIQNLKANIK